MEEDASTARTFRESAAKIMARRVLNSPPERDETKWLPGPGGKGRGVRRVEKMRDFTLAPPLDRIRRFSYSYAEAVRCLPN